MRNCAPQADQHKPNREDIAALPCLIRERSGRLNGNNAEYWIQAEMQLQIAELAELKQEAIEENEQHNLDRFWAMRALGRG